MGPYDELAADGPGPATRDLLAAVVRRVADEGGYLPPAPHAGWDDTALERAVRTLLGPSGTGFHLAGWSRACDDTTLEVVLTDVVSAHLADTARGWSAAELAERLAVAVLPDVQGLASTEDGWALVDPAGAVLLPPQPRRGVATGPLLVALVQVVLAEAAGPLPATELARRVQPRLHRPLAPRVRPIPVQGIGESAAPTEDGPEPGVLVRAFAEQLWAELSPLERTLVPHLGRPVDELGAVLELPPAAAEVAADGLVEHLRAACADDDRAAEVLVELRALCTQRP